MKRLVSRRRRGGYMSRLLGGLTWLSLAVCLLSLRTFFAQIPPSAEAPASPPSVSATVTAGEEMEEDDPSDEDIVIYKKPNDDMKIALTFDDGPHPRLTPVILDILAQYNVKATFFMIGENVRYYTPAAEAVIRAGHEIGNHTDSHHSLRPLDEAGLRREISACEEAIRSVAEYRPHFVRPPEGEMSEHMKRVMADMDYRIILWDVDTLDWAHTSPQKICRNVLDEIEAGDIILMHDFIGHNSPTPEALRMLIPALLERGYQFVTVGELLDGA